MYLSNGQQLIVNWLQCHKHTHTCTQHTCTHTSVTDDTNSSNSGKLHLRQLHFLSRRSSFLLSFLFSIVVVSQRCKAAGAAVVGNFTVFAAAAAPNGLFVAHQCCRFRFFFRQKKKLLLKANCGKHFGIAGSDLIYFFHN